MKAFIYNGPTTSATIYGNEVVLVDGKTVYMDPNSPLAVAMIEKGNLVAVDAAPAATAPAAPEASASALEADIRADINKLPNKAAVVDAIKSLNPEFEAGRETREQLEEILFSLAYSAATSTPAADEPATETETN